MTGGGEAPYTPTLKEKLPGVLVGYHTDSGGKRHTT